MAVCAGWGVVTWGRAWNFAAASPPLSPPSDHARPPVPHRTKGGTRPSRDAPAGGTGRRDRPHTSASVSVADQKSVQGNLGARRRRHSIGLHSAARGRPSAGSTPSVPRKKIGAAAMPCERGGRGGEGEAQPGVTPVPSTAAQLVYRRRVQAQRHCGRGNVGPERGKRQCPTASRPPPSGRVPVPPPPPAATNHGSHASQLAERKPPPPRVGRERTNPPLSSPPPRHSAQPSRCGGLASPPGGGR